MEYRTLGRAGVQVSPLCLGTMTFGVQVDEKTAAHMVDTALAAGINFVDTANSYGQTRSEEYVGKALMGRRHRVVLSTKVGNPVGEGPNARGLHRINIMNALEASLRRLQTDYIDIYLCHHPDPLTPLEESARAQEDLVRQGKVRFIGSSNHKAWQVAKVRAFCERNGMHPWTVEQPPYNLLRRGIERELLPYCVEEGIGVMVYSPLAGGLLTGKYRKGEPPPSGSRPTVWEYFQRQLTDRNLDAVERLRGLSHQWEKPLPHIALAWVLAQEGVSSAILGGTALEQLTENLLAAQWKMTPEEVQQVDEAVGRETILLNMD
ncbi:MAG: aldo/keto reductase [Chloroflexi bacterium]|nr:aldo/keto reductase [Chloroflexota bacterium]